MMPTHKVDWEEVAFQAAGYAAWGVVLWLGYKFFTLPVERTP